MSALEIFLSDAGEPDDEGGRGELEKGGREGRCPTLTPMISSFSYVRKVQE